MEVADQSGNDQTGGAQGGEDKRGFATGRPYTEEDLAFIEAHFNRDLSAAEIAERLGRTADAIIKAASGLRVAPRRAMRWSPETIAEVHRLAGLGLIASEIGRELGVSKDAITSLARREKIKLRKGRAGRPKREDAIKPEPVSPSTVPAQPKIRTTPVIERVDPDALRKAVLKASGGGTRAVPRDLVKKAKERLLAAGYTVHSSERGHTINRRPQILSDARLVAKAEQAGVL
jgi:biotin operon repressor/DNA-binding CsgD family transcriptional regulator